jgi:hypothetical protein
MLLEGDGTMNKFALYCGLLALAGAAFFVGEASASGWQIVGSVPVPVPNARGLSCWDPFDNSILCDGSPPRVYDLTNPSNYITLDVPSGVWGLGDWLGGGITVSNYRNSYIYHLTTTGSVISSFRCPKDHPADISTFPWDHYVAIPEENLALELTNDGSILSSFTGPGTRLTAIQADRRTEYICGDPVTGRVYFYGYGELALAKPSAIWATIKTGDGPPIDWFLVLDSATKHVYVVNWFGPESVAPSSLGRVKTLFR